MSTDSQNEAAKMKVAFVGCTQFGYNCLTEAIVNSPAITVSGIITTPQKISFSKSSSDMNIQTHADFRNVAEKYGCDLIEISEKPKAKDYLNIIEKWKPDIMIVLGWYYLIPQKVLDSLPKGTVAIHASLLPRYRGMAPISWAIINGEQETGVSFFYLEKGTDTGDIIAQEKFPISFADNCATVYQKATDSSVLLLKKYLPLLANDTAPRTKQNHREATSFPRRTPEDGLIDWRKSSLDIYNFVRAQTKPYPGAFTFVNGKRLVVWTASVVTSELGELNPGDAVIHEGRVLITTGDGSITIDSFQFEETSESDSKEILLKSLPDTFQSHA